LLTENDGHVEWGERTVYQVRSITNIVVVHLSPSVPAEIAIKE
jgi:hypothetical protein